MAATRATRVPMATAAPSRAERQPRVRPAATTIVSASTISTALARNTDTRSTMLALCTTDLPEAAG